MNAEDIVQMDEENKRYISQGHTFFIGINRVPVEKILEWREEAPIDWPSFLWYISLYFRIVDFSDHWFDVELKKKIILTRLYHKTVLYDMDLCKDLHEQAKLKKPKQINVLCTKYSLTDLPIRKRILFYNFSDK